MGKIETLALTVAVIGVGMALFYNKAGQGLELTKTQYGQGWSNGAGSIADLGAKNDGIIWL